MVKEGDLGDVSLLSDNELPITREFNKLVNEVVKLTYPKEAYDDTNQIKTTVRPGHLCQKAT